MICPKCKKKVSIDSFDFKNGILVCPYCKERPKLSKRYMNVVDITPVIIMVTAILIINSLTLDFIEKFILCPCLVSLSIFFLTILVIHSYPKKFVSR